MFKNFKIFPWGLSLWFSWVVVTIGYLMSGSVDLDNLVAWSGGAFLGMFTPLGFWSFFLGIFGGISRFINPDPDAHLIFSLISRIVLIGIVFFTLSYGEKLAQYFGIEASRPISKILFNLVILFCLTFIVDMYIYGAWRSMYFLIGLKIPGRSF